MFYLQTSVIKLPYLAWVFKHNTILEHKRTYIDSAAGQLTVHSATWPSLRAAASNMYVQFTESVSPFPVNVNKDDQQTANTHTHILIYTWLCFKQPILPWLPSMYYTWSCWSPWENFFEVSAARFLYWCAIITCWSTGGMPVDSKHHNKHKVYLGNIHWILNCILSNIGHGVLCY